MSGITNIAWADHQWQVTRGCTPRGPGCDNCYAESYAAKFSGFRGTFAFFVSRDLHGKPRWTGLVKPIEQNLGKPFKWRRPKRIVVNSMSDLFHPDVSNEWIAAVFAVMASCPQHTFQVLTKYAHRLSEWFAWIAHEAWPYPINHDFLAASAQEYLSDGSSIDTEDQFWNIRRRLDGMSWPLPNVHLGVSVEDQISADQRIPDLLKCPAGLHWVCCEPMLGPIDLQRYLERCTHNEDGECLVVSCPQKRNKERSPLENSCPMADSYSRLKWVVVGGETGNSPRMFNVAWARAIREQCVNASVPFFFDQLGYGQIIDQPPPRRHHRFVRDDDKLVRVVSKKGNNPQEIPNDILVRMYPGDDWSPTP